MSRATAVQALIDQWLANANESGLEATRIYNTVKVRTDAQERCYARADVWKKCAADLAALLLREGPPQEPNMSESTYYDCCDNFGTHLAKCTREALRANRAGLREGQKPPDVGQSSFTRASGDLESVPLAGLREGAPAPHCHAGEAPQEAMPDHCENCRAEMPVTTVHLCHACLPSAPRDDAGDAPATEPVNSHEESSPVEKHYVSSQQGSDSLSSYDWLAHKQIAEEQPQASSERVGHRESRPEMMIKTTPHLCPHCNKPTGGTVISPMASGVCSSLAASQAGTAPREAKIPRCTECGAIVSIVHTCFPKVAAHGAVPPQEP